MEYFQGRTDLTYRAEHSEDLVEWTTEGVTVAPVGDGPRVLAIVEGTPDSGFLRVVEAGEGACRGNGRLRVGFDADFLLG